MDNIITETLQSYIESENNKHQRFNSWYKCFKYFKDEYFQGNSDDDTAALHLGFYLASWGMYRGSTFLLQNDYTIHIGIVKILHDNKDLDFTDFKNIQKIKKQISDYYKKHANLSTSGSSNATDTLITKIILGVFAVTPAYDDFFKAGIDLQSKFNGDYKLTKSFNESSLDALNSFYDIHKKEFEPFEAKQKYFIEENKYPKMKLLDMFFWKLGYHYKKLKKEKIIIDHSDIDKNWKLVHDDIKKLSIKGEDCE